MTNNPLELAEQRHVEFVELQFTDMIGAVKRVTIPVAELPGALDHGIWFDGSSIEGFARIAESDMYLLPDQSTFAVLPWLSGGKATARLICDVYTPGGQPFLGFGHLVLGRRRGADKGIGVFGSWLAAGGQLVCTEPGDPRLEPLAEPGEVGQLGLQP